MALDAVLHAIRKMLFERGFDALERAYFLSVPEPTDHIAAADASIRSRLGIGPTAPLPSIEIQDGVPSNDYDDEIAQLADELASTQSILIEAFAIALFHFWEKQANKWLGVQKYVNNDVANWLLAEGSTPDSATLSELQLVANTFKHGAGRSASELFAQKPNLFDATMSSKPGFIPSEASLFLSKADLDRYYFAVKNSA